MCMRLCGVNMLCEKLLENTKQKAEGEEEEEEQKIKAIDLRWSCIIWFWYPIGTNDTWLLVYHQIACTAHTTNHLSIIATNCFANDIQVYIRVVDGFMVVYFMRNEQSHIFEWVSCVCVQDVCLGLQNMENSYPINICSIIVWL